MPEQRTWTVRAILDWTRGYLERRGDEHPRLSAEWLLSDATGLSRVEIYTSFDRPLSPDELSRMHSAIERRAAGEPLQYVTGEMPFRHIVLSCAPGVLIPRPETEVLVDECLAFLDATVAWPAKSAPDVLAAEGTAADCPATDAAGPDATDANGPDAEPELPEPACRVLEVGCGTGCVALSIASERPGAHVTTTDVSHAAVELAVRNRDALGLADAVDVVECDLASGVDEALMGGFDLLVSNPPYIPTDVLASQVPAEVRDHEPGLALDGGPDGLDVYRRLLELAPRALRPGGAMCVELYEGALDAARDLALEQGGWADVRIVEDLTHRPRVLVAVRGAQVA